MNQLRIGVLQPLGDQQANSRVTSQSREQFLALLESLTEAELIRVPPGAGAQFTIDFTDLNQHHATTVVLREVTHIVAREEINVDNAHSSAWQDAARALASVLDTAAHMCADPPRPDL